MSYKDTEIGRIPNEWELEKVIDYCEVVDYVANGSFKSLADNVKYNYGEKHARLIRLTDFHNNYSGDSVYVNKHAYEFLSKTKLYGGEIIIANVGANVGTVFQAPVMNTKMTLGPNTVVVKPKGNNKFYYYWFLSNNGQHTIKSIVGGSAQPKFNKTNFRQLKLPVPSNKEQIKIAKILSSIDDKIELNNKINNNLEELAQTLYKHWFVDFEFPNEEGLPYKSSGGKMIKSEKALIPEGWHTIYLDEYLEFERGVEPGSKNYNETQIRESIPFFRVGDLNVYNPTFVSKEHLKEKSVNLDDVLVSFDGAIGRVGIGFEGSYSTGLRKIYPKKDIFFPKEYIYYLFKSDDIQNTLKNYANGTTILHASSSIRFLKTFYNEKIIRDFSKVISPIFSKVIQIINENDKLAETRDLLLPKLMSGEIRVPIKE